MKNQKAMLMGIGAGLAFYRVWILRQQTQNTRQWGMRRASQDSPGTAFITGASSGIGEAFARALAQDGYNLVLAARREERLRSLAEKLQRGNPVRVETVAVDLSEAAGIAQAASALESIPDLELLVNNAGFGSHGSFVNVDPETHARMVRLHVEAPVRLARAALPGMVERGHGGIINISSIAGLVALPGNTTYGATKAYLNFFSDGLRKELTGTGVRVQALCPGFTHTEFHDVSRMSRDTVPSFAWMPAHKVVSESLIGLREDRGMVIPGRLYRALALVLRLPAVDQLARLVQEWRLAQEEEL